MPILRLRNVASTGRNALSSSSALTDWPPDLSVVRKQLGQMMQQTHAPSSASTRTPAPLKAATSVSARSPSHRSHACVSELMWYSGHWHAPQKAPRWPSAQGLLALSVKSNAPGVWLFVPMHAVGE